MTCKKVKIPLIFDWIPASRWKWTESLGARMEVTLAALTMRSGLSSPARMAPTWRYPIFWIGLWRPLKSNGDWGRTFGDVSALMASCQGEFLLLTMLSNWKRQNISNSRCPNGKLPQCPDGSNFDHSFGGYYQYNSCKIEEWWLSLIGYSWKHYDC